MKVKDIVEIKEIFNVNNLGGIFKNRSSYPDGKHYINCVELHKELNEIVITEIGELEVKLTLDEERIIKIIDETQDIPVHNALDGMMAMDYMKKKIAQALKSKSDELIIKGE